MPDSRHDVRWPDSRLQGAISVDRAVNGKPLRFLVEPTRVGSVHACTVDDITTLMQLIPPAAHAAIGLFVLRQPTRKEEVLRPAWGRLVWCFGDLGPAVVLDAMSPGTSLRVPRSARPDEAAELERLKEAGFPVVGTRRDHVLTMTIEAVRSLQLFHTVLHELGHLIDREARSEAGDDESYFARPAAEREAFAHRHADERRMALRVAGKIPFERILAPDSLARDGLLARWFTLEP